MGVVGYRASSVRYPLDFWHWEKRSGNPEDFFKKSGALENTSELKADQDHVNNFSDGGEDQFDREFFDLSSICTSAIAGSFPAFFLKGKNIGGARSYNGFNRAPLSRMSSDRFHAVISSMVTSSFPLGKKTAVKRISLSFPSLQ